MQKILFILSVLSFSVSLSAQNNLNGVVFYGHKQSMGMGAAIGIDYNSVLIFNSEKSSYVFAKDSLEGGHIYENKNIKNNKEAYYVTKVTNKIGFTYFHNSLKNSSKYRDLGFKYVNESIPKIDWNITSTTKIIGKFTCIKAKAHFRGREYTAWYTMSIPLPYGPWKLQGLPGLILEAYDTHKEVYFYFKSLEYPYSKQVTITEPNPKWENKKWISFQDYKDFLKSSFKRGRENGRLASESVGLTILEHKEISMKDNYVEVFDEEE